MYVCMYLFMNDLPQGYVYGVLEEGGGEKYPIGCFLYVTQSGIEPAAFWCVGLSQSFRAQSYFFLLLF